MGIRRVSKLGYHKYYLDKIFEGMIMVLIESRGESWGLIDYASTYR